MLQVRALVSPARIWMMIFPDFAEILQDALSPVIGDLISREHIFVNSEYGEETSDIQAHIELRWRHLREPPLSLFNLMAKEAKIAALDYIRENYPGVIVNVQVTARLYNG